ncbi:MAG: low molecular weight phosphotyrosine protein phosphatase [Bacteroidia bacterium]|nr:low molecular weight phosphotyrosine protein phosphatase [Bacteroidia bacterium]
MVCLGNICRSPMAEGVLRNRIEQAGLKIIVDSAGTADYHTGEAPDYRAVSVLRKHGIDISGLAARQFNERDFDDFDEIYVMDQSNLNNVLTLARSEEDRLKVRLILNTVHPGLNRSLADPFYGDISHFEAVYAQLNQAAAAIISQLK